MIRITSVLLVLSPTLAVAQPDAAPVDPTVETVATPLEPGTLGRGRVAGRFGAGLGSGPLGLGGELAVGLGGVDLLASAGYLPRFCLDLGDLGSGCDPAQVLLGLGAQARLVESGRTRLGARIKGDASVAGDRVGLGVAGIDASTGNQAVRVSLGVVTAGWYEEDNPFGRNGFYVGPEVGLQYLRGHAGGALTFGYGLPLQGQERSMPMMSATAIWR